MLLHDHVDLDAAADHLLRRARRRRVALEVDLAHLGRAMSHREHVDGGLHVVLGGNVGEAHLGDRLGDTNDRLELADGDGHRARRLAAPLELGVLLHQPLTDLHRVVLKRLHRRLRQPWRALFARVGDVPLENWNVELTLHGLTHGGGALDVHLEDVRRKRPVLVEVVLVA